ncbi:hypothetical protein IMCC3317_23240 [Kordia antarctica]|uniref:Uncharacterized protein n=1 Tax=Kordia antarctica TaxID=1218801 RepID=A0A7L4ZJR2_9FLAO|nr:hypothetical protein [Kordia antarctica]QHI36953.1 hypothetical protein IMCC3317_23240 [Kordia antarctica]
MEDFDYIDALAQSELSNRTAVPSADGWNIIQQKMKRAKRKKFLVFFLLFALICSFGIYQAINFNSEIDSNSVTNKNLEQFKSGNNNNSNQHKNTDSNSSSLSDSLSTSTSTSISDKDASQAGTNTAGTQTTTQKNQYQTAKNTNTTSISSSISFSNTTLENTEEEFLLEAAGVKLTPWELITPETLKRKRKKRSKKAKAEKVYENLDLMIGLNGFFKPNDYEFFKSYVIEVSYTEEKKLKNNYYLNYGASVQFRNLRFKNDAGSFNRGELSLNLLTSLEKRFGNYGVEAGAYIGYEFYAPNNKIFDSKIANFFERKINYGLATTLNYKKIGLVFKYEFSPYINYLGNKRFGGFTIGVKYDF